MVASESVRPPYCDLVMKGGITSGIVYPAAVCNLAEVYRFRNIGGTSAGAIAAAATAAAELGWRRGNAKSYDCLAHLPDKLAGSRLLELFRPDPATRPIFQFLLAIARARGWGKAMVGVLTMARITPWWLWLLLLAWLAGWTSVLVSIAGDRLSPAVWILTVLWGLLWVGALLVGRGAYLARWAAATLPANFYGLCTGCAPAPRRKYPWFVAWLYKRVTRRVPGQEYPSLTEWLYELFNRLAGLPPDQPLTFGHLWNAPTMDWEVVIDGRVINLEVMTTDLTRGRPYRVPFEVCPESPPTTPSAAGPSVERNYLYFSEEEWNRLFPRPVIDWLKAKADTNADPVRPVRAHPTGPETSLVPLPQAADLPVLVAARVSLSFPLLISAVPLYAIDKTLAKNTAPPYQAERVWFSDGGISSNFPIHFFDDPLPRWPTFGINFVAPRPRPDGKDPLTPWIAGPNTQGWLQYWDRFGSGLTPGPVSAFLGAIFQTMQNWRDNLQVRVPGYWDRVVHVPLGKKEGGLNLTMGPKAVHRLSKRGGAAGAELLKTFCWTDHAWIRYRSTMGAMGDFLEQFNKAYQNPVPGDREAWDLINGFSRTGPPSYPWIGGQAAWAPRATHELVGLVSGWKARGERFQDGAPAPAPELRVAPRVSATLAER